MKIYKNLVNVWIVGCAAFAGILLPAVSNAAPGTKKVQANAAIYLSVKDTSRRQIVCTAENAKVFLGTIASKKGTELTLKQVSSSTLQVKLTKKAKKECLHKAAAPACSDGRDYYSKRGYAMCGARGGSSYFEKRLVEIK